MVDELSELSHSPLLHVDSQKSPLGPSFTDRAGKAGESQVAQGRFSVAAAEEAAAFGYPTGI